MSDLTSPPATLTDLALARGTVDRLSDLRTRPGLLTEWWSDESSRVVRVARGRTPVRGHGDEVQLDLVPPSAVGEGGVRAILGRGVNGVRYLTAEVAEDPGTGTDTGTDTGTEWADLRMLARFLDDTQAGLLAQAVGLLHWHATHTRCPRCGAPTEVVAAGWVRRCPEDGSEHFPRTDPAVIMSVVDADDRILLGHNDAWPPARYSTLAGFVEPGESLEAAVRREVAEEVGVIVGDVTYVGSQPWPFPASLMLGFHAHATSTAVVTDDVEITEARWFSRGELAAAITSGEVRLPPGVSISRRLIERWFGRPIPDDTPWP